MKRLWLADVHANLPALRAVLQDVGDYDEVVFLGDITGFGPHPAECVDILMRINPRAVIGNHDSAILSLEDKDVSTLDPLKSWDDWTYLKLKESQISYLKELPASIRLTACGRPAVVLHTLPGKPYLHPDMPDSVLDRLISGFREGLIVLGHSHYPMDRQLGNKRVICVPSAGQPRNGKPDAGYAVEEDGDMSFRFTSYDTEKTAEDVAAIGFPEPFSERWINFLRTGYDSEWSREYF